LPFFFYPASIRIFLAFFIVAPVPENIAVLDGLVLFSAATLFGCGYCDRTDNLAFFSGKTILAEKFIELFEKFLAVIPSAS